LLQTYDGQYIKIYINNSLVGQTEYFGNFGSQSGDLMIGNDITYNNRFFHGSIDDIKIYNRSLNETEINDLYCDNGRKVMTLIDGYRNAGTYHIPWNAGDQPSGIYFVMLRAKSDSEEFISKQKIVLLK